MSSKNDVNLTIPPVINMTVNIFVNLHLKAMNQNLTQLIKPNIQTMSVESQQDYVAIPVLTKLVIPRCFKVVTTWISFNSLFLAVKPVLVNVNFLSNTKAKHITTALIPSLMEVRVLNGNPFYGARRKRIPMGTWLMGDGESVIWRRVNLKTKVVLQFVSFTLLILHTFSSENNQKLDFL